MWFINTVPDCGITELLELQTPEMDWFFVWLFLAKHNPKSLGCFFFFLMNLTMNFLKSKTSRKCLYWYYTGRGFWIKGELVSSLTSQSRTASIQGPQQGYSPRAERHGERLWPASHQTQVLENPSAEPSHHGLHQGSPLLLPPSLKGKSVSCLPRSTQNLKDPNTWGFRHCLQEIS